MSSVQAPESKPPAVKKVEVKPRVKISRPEKKDDLKGRGPRSVEAERLRPDLEDQVRLAAFQLQALVRERSDCEQAGTAPTLTISV